MWQSAGIQRLLTRQRIYLDHAATTPVLPVAREAMAGDERSGPIRARRMRKGEPRTRARARRAGRSRRRWAGGMTSSLPAAPAKPSKSPRRGRIAGRAHGATEHPIVGHAMGAGVERRSGRSRRSHRRSSAERNPRRGPALVAIQQVNNETGVIQPLDRLAEKIRGAGSLLLVDCAQSAGKLPLPDADFIAACAHKLGGPPGIGVLLVRDLAMLEAVGGQEKGYRRGTQDAPAAAAFAAALAARPTTWTGWRRCGPGSRTVSGTSAA